MQTLLTIAGFDPSSGAGVTADLMVFAAHGFFGTSCITSLTVQSTIGVLSSHPVDTEIVARTLRCLEDDIPAVGIKIGMLATAGIAEAVAGFLTPLRARLPHLPIVLDPVLRSSSGRELLDAAGLKVLSNRLLPLVNWITPNADELAILIGQPVRDKEELKRGAWLLHERTGGRVHVLAKGGHLDRPDDLLVTTGGKEHWLSGERIETASTHGTGCALSSALLSGLALGRAPLPAAEAAKSYVVTAMLTAAPLGDGRGPLNHLWPLRC